jgi:hypothetical protein
MAKTDNDPIEVQTPVVPTEVFGHAAMGIEFALTELLKDIALADTYTGDDAIVYAVGLLGTTHTLQTYLFGHFDELIHKKKLETYAENTDKK